MPLEFLFFDLRLAIAQAIFGFFLFETYFVFHPFHPVPPNNLK